MSNNSLVDLSWIGDIACKLIDAIENACGWIVNHDTPERIAVQTYIDEVNNSNYSPIEKAAMISNAKKDIKEYKNQYQVVRKASNLLKKSARPDCVDEDWLSHFMDKTRFVSEEEVQHIWAKLLADECNEPNSVPKSLLFILEKMDREDAEMFMNLGNLSVKIDDTYAPLIIDKLYENGFYERYGINFDCIMQMEKIGLITSCISSPAEYGLSETDLDDGEQSIAFYFGRKYAFPHGYKSIPVGKVLYSKDGQALRKAVNCEEKESFWEEVAMPWFKEISNKYETGKKK